MPPKANHKDDPAGQLQFLLCCIRNSTGGLRFDWDRIASEREIKVGAAQKRLQRLLAPEGLKMSDIAGSGRSADANPAPKQPVKQLVKQPAKPRRSTSTFKTEINKMDDALNDEVDLKEEQNELDIALAEAKMHPIAHGEALANEGSETNKINGRGPSFSRPTMKHAADSELPEGGEEYVEWNKKRRARQLGGRTPLPDFPGEDVNLSIKKATRSSAVKAAAAAAGTADETKSAKAANARMDQHIDEAFGEI